ncbi:MAG: FKBP-type peptidyl-prolyl cis-trans isomerase [Kofleriaceae bacterium]
MGRVSGRLGVVVAVALGLGAGCQRKATPRPAAADAGAATDAAPVARLQEPPPLPLAPIPADAETVTGVAPAPTAVVRIKRLVAGAGPRPGRNDLVSVNFTGWRTTGDTFITTTARKRPVQKHLSMVAPGFAAAVETMQVGERAMVWLPPELGYNGPAQGVPEPTVYAIELVAFEPSPPVPADVGAPPAAATATASGLRSLVLTPGTGAARPRPWDEVTYHYTAWDATGRMFDSSVVRHRPTTTMGFREWRGVEEALGLMVVGERRRAWLPPALVDHALPGVPAGTLCYELELLGVKPQPAPPAAPPLAELTTPPATARATPGGVRFELLATGKGTVHPGRGDRVEVRFTGWTADGRLFDSSIPGGTPIVATVDKFIPGWIEALTQMVAGDRARVWVPVELAFNHEPGRPPGPLVFELELVDVLPPRTPVVTGPKVQLTPPSPTP